MNKALPLVGILVFLAGSALVLGSFFVFNQYNLGYSHDFPVGAIEQQGGTWEFPAPPLQLNKGDTIRLDVTMNASRYATFRVVNTEHSWVYEEIVHNNFTVYYYVRTSDLYSFYIRLGSGTMNTIIHTESRLEVHGKAPNELFLVIGILVLLSSFVTIPTIYLYTKKT